MLITKGLRNYVMQVFPKRTFDLLIDPGCMDRFLSSSHTDLFQLLLDLRQLNPPINIRFLVNERNGLPEPFAEAPIGGTDLIEYSPTNPLDNDPRAKVMEETALADCQRKLCALAIQTKADGVVTSDQGLLDARYPLLHDRINLMPMDELEDFVEICAHGHNVFWSASYSSAIYQDVYYVFAHPKCCKLATWW